MSGIGGKDIVFVYDAGNLEERYDNWSDVARLKVQKVDEKQFLERGACDIVEEW